MNEEKSLFLKNTWYVVAHSNAINRTLKALKILGENIVFYRDTQGKPVALEDACPHRKLPLSMGALQGDTVQCGYHGLTFDCSGSCVNAPTQNKIPVNARVRSYPVVDKYKLLWIWMGDTAQVDENKILHVPDYYDPTWGLTDGGMLQCQCHYLYLMDNLLDPSHVAWVHATSFASEGTENSPLDIVGDEAGVTVSRWIKDILPPPYYADRLTFKGKTDRLQYYQAVLPSTAINMSTYTPSGTGGAERVLPANAYCMRSYHFLTPIDENNTRYHWFQHFNTDTDNPAVKEKLNEGARAAFEEDRVVLEAVHRGMHGKQTPNIDLRLDAGARIFRKKLKGLLASEAVD